MKFNANKFELLRYGKEQEIKSATTYKSYDDSNIDNKEQVRDRGIMMNNTATFTLHIRYIVKKERDKKGWVLRVFQSRKRSLMLTLLKSPVIPLPALESMEFQECQHGIHGKQKTYMIAKLFNERLHRKSLMYSTYTTGKECTNQIILSLETP